MELKKAKAIRHALNEIDEIKALKNFLYEPDVKLVLVKGDDVNTIELEDVIKPIIERYFNERRDDLIKKIEDL